MRCQLSLWDEVYRLWYFNDHITTLLISEKKCYMLSIQDMKSPKKISHLLFNRYIYRERHGNITYGKSYKIIAYIYVHMNKSVYMNYRITVWIL